MQFLTFLSSIAMPFVILIIVVYGLIERNKVFDNFLEGAKEGLEIVFSIFPTLIGLFVAIGALRSSGIIDGIVNFLNPILSIVNFPSEIMPLALLRPISGSASIAVATDIMKTYGIDSNIGIIASVIMGSTETTLYTIAVYTSSVRIKKTKFILAAALIADVVRNACKCYSLSIYVVEFLLTNNKLQIIMIKISLLFFINMICTSFLSQKAFICNNNFYSFFLFQKEDINVSQNHFIYFNIFIIKKNNYLCPSKKSFEKNI